jgi:hypothetical protein
MNETYELAYVPGQIIVLFKNDVQRKDFIRDFGNMLGYTLLDEKSYTDYVYVFQTEQEKEQDAINKFQLYTEFVEWAERRDKKYEIRLKTLEDAITQLQGLYENVNIPRKEYNTQLSTISSYLKALKE